MIFYHKKCCFSRGFKYIQGKHLLYKKYDLIFVNSIPRLTNYNNEQANNKSAVLCKLSPYTVDNYVYLCYNNLKVKYICNAFTHHTNAVTIVFSRSAQLREF